MHTSGVRALDVQGYAAGLAAIGGLVTLVLIAGAIVAIYTYARRDNVEKKQAEWLGQYRAQLAYVEPRLKEAMAENKVMRDLLNPTELMKENTAKIMSALDTQRGLLESIERKVDEHHDG